MSRFEVGDSFYSLDKVGDGYFLKEHTVSGVQTFGNASLLLYAVDDKVLIVSESEVAKTFEEGARSLMEADPSLTVCSLCGRIEKRNDKGFYSGSRMLCGVCVGSIVASAGEKEEKNNSAEEEKEEEGKS